VILIDTHAHLDDHTFDHDRAQVLERALAAEVHFVITVGTDLNSSRVAVALARHKATIYATVGVHPHDASTLCPETLSELECLAREERVVAIGEIGMDLYRNLSSPAAQKEAFIAQLELARRLDKPVVIHDRDAHLETMTILRQCGPEWHGVLHCFSGDEEMARKAIQMGFYISFAGPVTFENARRLQSIARLLPLERILIETDCPYLTPHPYRGKRNEPANVHWVAAKIAALRGLPIERVAEATTRNAQQLFGL